MDLLTTSTDTMMKALAFGIVFAIPFIFIGLKAMSRMDNESGVQDAISASLLALTDNTRK